MICDYAEAFNGKLYISGGGWTLRIGAPRLDCSLAVRLAVPWNQANLKHRLLITLLTEDGQEVVDLLEAPVRIEGEFEVGRPPGLSPGDALTEAFVFRIQGLTISDGVFVFSLQVNGTEIASARFRNKLGDG